MIIKSPFIIYRECISPLLCDQIIESYKDKPRGEYTEEVISNSIKQHILNNVQQIEQHYNIIIEGIEIPKIIKVQTNDVTDIVCENSKFLRSKWVQIHHRALTGVVFLNDSNFKPPFDRNTDVFGGKLEFIQHEFGLNSIKGLCVLYPSGPHFVNRFTSPEIGDLHYVKFHIKSTNPFIYQPNDFPGDYTNWFKNDV
jgi:hypothetical protein